MTAQLNMDWTPTTFAREPWYYYALGLTVLVMLIGWRVLTLTDLCLMAGLALMGLKLVRHTPFFYFAMAAILPLYLDEAARPLHGRLSPRMRTGAVAVILLAAIGWGWLFYQPIVEKYGWFNAGLRTWHYPVAAAEFVEGEKLPANLYNTYDWGGYLEWTLFPRYRVFWDGRQNDAEMFRQGWNVMAGQSDWQVILDRHDVNTILTRPLTIDTGQRYPLLDRLRESSGWVLVYADDVALIFVRHGSHPADWVEAHRLPPDRIDDAILATARLMTDVDPRRYKGWYEMAQVHLRRRELPAAKAALEQYLSRSPERDPMAERTWQMLDSMTR